MNKFGFGQKATAKVTRGRELKNRFTPKGFFTIEVTDKDGNVKGSYKIPNGVTDVGINKALDLLFFDSQTKITGWVIGLIDAAGYSAVAAGDTMASHAGWVEFTDYSEANRVVWGPVAAAAQAIANTTPATFNITAAGAENLKGVFVVDQNTKGGTTGTLWATALFAGDIPVTNGDQVKITYTVNGS
jgi:hypothetical protein